MTGIASAPSSAPARSRSQSTSSTPHRPRAASGTDAAGRRPRRARLELRHVGPWAVLKTSSVLSLPLFCLWMVLVGVVFGLLQVTGVNSATNRTVMAIRSAGSSPPASAANAFGFAAIIGVVCMLLFILLTTLGSIVYNIGADIVGGVEITLTEGE